MLRKDQDSSWNLSVDSVQSKHHRSKGQCALKKYTKKGKKKIENEKKFGHWSVCENLRYLGFLKLNKQQFELSEHRKVWKIYKAMSIYIQSRDIYQCRSHHQKMLQKYYSVDDLILDLSRCYQQNQIEKLANIQHQKNKDVNQQKKIKTIKPNQTQCSQKEDKISSNKYLDHQFISNGQNIMISPNYNHLFNIPQPYPMNFLAYSNLMVHYQQNSYYDCLIKKEE